MSAERRAYRVREAAWVLLLGAVAAAFPVITGSQSAPELGDGHGVGLFDSDPSHIWNQLHRCFLRRSSGAGAGFGEESLDPLLWPKTAHLLTGDSHRRALECLDEFLKTHAERQVRDPVRRAIFLRDLWAVFDWSVRGTDYVSQRRGLQVPLAEVLRRVALTSQEITALPDNYAAAIRAKAFAADYDAAEPQRPFLPPDLFDPRGSWVGITLRGYGPVAPLHIAELSARSRFIVLVRLPGGRAATEAYLRTLWEFPEPITRNDMPNLNFPQFPVGTMVALVRQMNLFDTNGKLIATPITESLQIRVYNTVPSSARVLQADNLSARQLQSSFEFRLDRRALFAGQPGLTPIRDEDVEFPVFSTHGEDRFETPSAQGPSKILSSCNHCHADAGIHSVQSRHQIVMMREHAAKDVVDDPHYGPVYWETEASLESKQERYDWGLLNGYWNARQTFQH